MFTSCCPAWVRFLENNYPELKEHLSSAKSPQQIGGAIFKTYGAQLDGKEGKIFTVFLSCPAPARSSSVSVRR